MDWLLVTDYMRASTARMSRFDQALKESYQSYRVELRNEKGQQVLAQGNLAARAMRNGRNISLSVPVKVINSGRYEVAVKGISKTGETEDVGFYYFDVVKQ